MVFVSEYRILALIIIIIFINSKENDLRKINKVSEITLKIIGNGTQHIFKDSSKLPSKLQINGNDVGTVGTYINIDNPNQNESNITMIWNNDLTNCSNMFIDNSNITEIDLSQFDTSSVTTMAYMFYGQSKITSLNLDNFDTTLVKSMYGMFSGCTKLTSLDLSNFNTALVTDFGLMFYGQSNNIIILIRIIDIYISTYCSNIISIN